MMTRRLYYWLVLMHPKEFRDRFGHEMLWIFDQAPPQSGLRLVGDALVSLLRQWLLRSKLPLMAAASAVAAIQVAAVGWLWVAAARRTLAGIVGSLSAARTPADAAMLLLFIAAIMTAVVLSSTLAAVWFAFKYLRRRTTS